MIDAALLSAATEEWLESLRIRRATSGLLAPYGDDLALAVLAGSLVEQDRARDGALLADGELTIDRLEILGDDPAQLCVDLDATLVFPADVVVAGELAPGRALGEVTVGLGPVYFGFVDDQLRLVDYTVGSQRMSAMWCTHPDGEDAKGGLAVVPQAVTVEAHRGGRVLMEVSNVLERDVTLRIGRPERPKGLFTRQPPVEPPEVGIPVPAGSSTHLAGLTRRSRLTEVELFAFDASDLTPVAPLLVTIELPRGHPGEHGQWCA